uniref:HECT domain-containing protein n=1 Tax=Clytia hemisphaerica TaxID=252671 RepID=A0A7M5WU13_9CNID
MKYVKIYTISKVRKGRTNPLKLKMPLLNLNFFLPALIQIDLRVYCFLFFAIGMDRIPVFGLEKKIDIEFVNVDRLPKTSTCGLMMEIPRNKTQERCEYALRHCKTYGIA